MPEIVVVVPIYRDTFVMVLHPHRGWEFPGGRVEKGESEIDAALRECREEAGIVISKLREIYRDGNMVVFAANVREINGGEFEYRIFKTLPDNLSYPREEAETFLNLAFKHKKIFQ